MGLVERLRTALLRLVRDPLTWLVAVWIGVGLVWLRLNRWNRYFELDESGYVSMAVRVGEADWAQRWHILTTEGNHGPLQAILALPPQMLSIADPRVVLIENLFLAAATAVVTCFTVRRLATRSAGTVAAALVLLSPGVIEHSRTALTSTPSVFFASLALYFLVRGSGLERAGWAAATGAALGAMTLARSMTIGLVPAVAVIGLGFAFSRRTSIWTVVRNGAVTVLTAIVTASWWWILRWSDVGSYVFGGGSDDTEQYHEPITKLGLHGVELFSYLGGLVVFVGLVAALVLLPLRPGRSRRERVVDVLLAVAVAVALAVGLLTALQHVEDPFALDPLRYLLWPVLFVGVAVPTFRRAVGAGAGSTGGARAGVERSGGSDRLAVWPVWAGTLAGLVLLSASTAYGVGFALPLVPWLAAAASATVGRRLSGRAWKWWWGPVVVASLVVAVTLPGSGMHTRVIWCIADAPKAFCDITSTEEGRRWEATNDRIAERLTAITGAETAAGRGAPRVAMTGRGFAVNPNTVGLSLVMRDGPELPLADFLQGDTSVDDQLAAVVRDADVVVVLPDRYTDIILTEGSPTPDQVAAAVEGAGFRTCDEIPVPDGRTVTVFVAPGVPAAACAASPG